MDEQLGAVDAVLDNIDAMVNAGKRLPLTNQYVVNRDVMMAAIQDLRDKLPRAVEQAVALLAKEEEIRERANNDYNNTMAEAESKARAMGLESKQRADKILTDAQNQADQMYDDAQRQTQAMIEDAHRKADELVADSAILREADKEATQLRNETRAENQRDRLAALNHCEELLRRAEDAAIKVANELRDIRMGYDEER